nr:MAG TPA: hypothetical protein [Caudoviricetes sp.]
MRYFRILQVTEKVLPSPCFLLVTYRFPTFPFSPLFTPSHTQFHFSTSRHQKSTAIAVITVLPGFNVFSICKVYLELSSLGCFLYRNSESPIYRTHRRFCYLRVSYPAIFRTCERFSRQF